MKRYSPFLLSLAVCLGFLPIFAQNSRSDGVVFSRNGFPAPSASVAVCSPVAITAASEVIGTVTITSTLNPAQGSTVQIVGMTPTQYNGSYTVLTTSGTNFTYTNPVQGLGAGTVFGTALVVSTTPCSPLAPLCASFTDTTCSSSNPVTADGLGNYSFYVKPGRYTAQFYGSGLTARLQPDQILQCDPSNCSLTSATITGAATTQSINGDRWVGTGSGQFSSMAACYAALSAGQLCDVTAGWSETFSANLTMNTANTGFRFHGSAQITLGAFQILDSTAGGTNGFYFSGPANNPFGGANAVRFIYTGTGAAIVIGNSAATTYGVRLDSIMVDIVGAGTSATCFNLKNVVHYTMSHPACRGSNTSTQVGILLDGTGGYTGDGTIIEPFFFQVGVAIRGTGSGTNLANANTITGGVDQSAPASGICLDIQGGNGNIVNLLDCGSVPTIVNIAAGANNSSNTISAYNCNETSFATIGANANGNQITALGGCSIAGKVTDSGNNIVIGITGPNRTNYGSAGVTLLNFQGPAGAITGTGAAATVYTYTMPANTIGPGKGIRVRFGLNHSTGTASVTYALTFGGTSLGTISSAVNSSSGGGETMIFNNAGVTNAQSAFNFPLGGPLATWLGTGTAAIATTSSVVITLTFSVANTDQVTPQWWTVELIQ